MVGVGQLVKGVCYSDQTGKTLGVFDKLEPNGLPMFIDNVPAPTSYEPCKTGTQPQQPPPQQPLQQMQQQQQLQQQLQQIQQQPLEQQQQQQQPQPQMQQQLQQPQQQQQLQQQLQQIQQQPLQQPQPTSNNNKRYKLIIEQFYMEQLFGRDRTTQDRIRFLEKEYVTDNDIKQGVYKAGDNGFKYIPGNLTAVIGNTSEKKTIKDPRVTLDDKAETATITNDMSGKKIIQVNFPSLPRAFGASEKTMIDPKTGEPVGTSIGSVAGGARRVQKNMRPRKAVFTRSIRRTRRIRRTVKRRKTKSRRHL